jgi:hypothetical protein
MFQGEFFVKTERSAKRQPNVFWSTSQDGSYHFKSGAEYSHDKKIKWKPKFIPRGRLTAISIEKVKDDKLPHFKFQEKIYKTNFYNHSGGGILGLPEYIFANTKYTDYDGGVLGYRRYGANMVRDLLCRSMPVLKKIHVQNTVDKKHYIKFRREASCMRCHETIDNIGKLIGHLTMFYPKNEQAADAYIFLYPVQTKDKIPSKFSYLDLMGKHYNEPMKNLDDLGKSIINNIDFNLCASSRYYEFVSGVKINWEKHTKDEMLNGKITSSVYNLAIDFKKNKSLKELLKKSYSVLYKEEAK